MSNWNHEYITNPAAEPDPYSSNQQPPPPEPQAGQYTRQPPPQNYPISDGTALTIDINMGSSSNYYDRTPMPYHDSVAIKPEDLNDYDDYIRMQRTRTQSMGSDDRHSYGSSAFDSDVVTPDGAADFNSNLYDYNLTPSSANTAGAGAYNFFGSTYNNAADLTPRYDQSMDYQQTKESPPPPPAESPLTYTEPLPPKREYQCLHESCTQKPFGRSADLLRHVQLVHGKLQDKERFFCDYRKCHRNEEAYVPPPHSQPTAGSGPFHRRDHFRDHLRTFHMEDLPKRGGKEGKAAEERAVSSSWWRCNKCLRRVKVRHDGFECPNCKSGCETDRMNARKRLHAQGAASSHSHHHHGR